MAIFLRAGRPLWIVGRDISKFGGGTGIVIRSIIKLHFSVRIRTLKACRR